MKHDDKIVRTFSNRADRAAWADYLREKCGCRRLVYGQSINGLYYLQGLEEDDRPSVPRS